MKAGDIGSNSGSKISYLSGLGPVHGLLHDRLRLCFRGWRWPLGTRHWGRGQTRTGIPSLSRRSLRRSLLPAPTWRHRADCKDSADSALGQEGAGLRWGGGEAFPKYLAMQVPGHRVGGAVSRVTRPGAAGLKPQP